jgi:hypothetical protein
MSALDDARTRIIAKLDRIPDSDAVTLDKADVRALIAEHERLTAPPTDVERSMLEATISDALFDWDGDTRPAGRITEYVLAAGFRRQGPITDAQVEAAAEALWGEDRRGTYQPGYPYSGLAEEGRERLRVRARAALEAARAVS